MNDKYCVLQDDLKDCGVCSLLSIIKYYNGNISKEYLRELTKTTKEGVSALNILRASREIGFESYGIKGKIKSLNGPVLPAIAHVIIDGKYPHFVVIYKIDHKKKQLLIMDPAIGFTNYNIIDFNKISTGYYLIMKPKQVIPKYVHNINYSERIKELIKTYKKVFFTIIVMSILYTLINIIESYQFKLLFDESLNTELKKIFIVLLIFIFFKCLFSYLRNSLINLFNIILDKSLIKDSFYHIINLPYLYYRNHTNGDLINRINDLGNAKDLISNLFVSIFVDLSLAIIVLIMMINVNLKLSLITFTSLGLYSLVVFINEKNIKKMIRTNYQESALVNNHLIESLSSFETIKNLSLQKYIYRKFIVIYDSYNNNLKRLMNSLNKEEIIKNIFLSLGNLLVIYIGVKLIHNSHLSISSLITYIALSNYLIDPVRNILSLHFKYQNYKESFSRIKEIYNIPKENLKNNIDYLKGCIEVNNVTYSYNGIDNIINNLSFEIKEGEKVLIYGKSGSGKSTIIKLLIKYLDNNYEGLIKVGGYDLKNLDLMSLRNNICYISQNEYLYSDSIYENITLGKKIKYHEFLDLTDNLYINEIIKNSSVGYNYVIENNGENISGGERKRIIIARSVLMKANIYIYDESFSELDIEKERNILNYLFNLYPDKTFIIISHRFSNIDLFNKKIEIGEGKYEFIK